MRGLEHYLNSATALPAVLLELVRLRVSLMNGCEFCVGHHTRELEKHNEPASRIDALRDWSSSDAFTPRERSALAWADSVTAIASSGAADPEYHDVSTYFAPKDLVDLTMAVASVNAWNRMSIAFRAQWDPARGTRPSGRPSNAENLSPMGAIAAENGRPGALGGLPGSCNPSSKQQQTGSAPAESPTVDVIEDDGSKVAHN